MEKINCTADKKKPRLVFLGSGNLATQLSLALRQKGYPIIQVYSRTEESASALAEKLGCPYTIDISFLNPDGDIYISALKDSAIEDVLSKTNLKDKLLLHTAGSVPMDILSSYSSCYGVLYPLQTLSKGRAVDFSKIPVFIEGKDAECLSVIKRLAEDVSETVYEIPSEQRMYLHLAAVFVSNFVNYMYALGDDILKEAGIPFSVLLPLIDETAAKVHDLSAKEAQTGPAVRYDKNVINKHLALLNDNEKMQQLYELLSRHIYRQSKKEL
jgi:predicted short-subunit dehydrogenase-like oxidoreductase (DUF2520 family)